MKIAAPIGLIVKVETIYKGFDYERRLDLIKQYSKQDLLKYLATINFLPNVGFEDTFDKQIGTLRILVENNKELFDKICKQALRLKADIHIPLIFSRASTLTAIEEILQSDIKNESCRKIAPENFLKYYLSVNSFIAESQHKSDRDKSDLSFEEKFVAGTAPSNTFFHDFRPIESMRRGICLSHFFQSHEKYGQHYKSYFDKIGYKPELFMVWLMRCIMPSLRMQRVHCPIVAPQLKQDKIIFNHLSSGTVNKNKVLLETFNVTKKPIYKFEDGRYLLLDKELILDKSYHSLINDFYFDKLKNEDEDWGEYKKEIGIFFEKYVGQKIKSAFGFLKHPSPKVLGELKKKLPSGKKELADFYVRQNKRILIGQVKASAINSKSKYSNLNDDFYKQKKKRFYKAFGVEQFVNVTLDLIVNSPQVFDDKFPINKKVQIYPVIVSNERILAAPFIGVSFQDYFIEKIKGRFQDVSWSGNITDKVVINKTIEIRPLIIWSIEDVETLELYIKRGKMVIWDILKKHIRNSQLQIPFSETLKRNTKMLERQEYLSEDLMPFMEEVQKKLIKEKNASDQ